MGESKRRRSAFIAMRESGFAIKTVGVCLLYTSSLDTENELLIQSALQRLIKGRTTFAIAHRLSTLKNADRLLVLDHGRMAELGTHNELIEKKGIYYNLVMAQLNMTRLVGDVEVSDEAFIDEIKNK